jgi:hypothetical protein
MNRLKLLAFAGTLLTASAAFSAAAATTTVSRTNEPTTAVLGDFGPAFANHPNKTGYNTNVPDRMFLDSLPVNCAAPQRLTSASFTIDLAKLTQGPNRGDNDGLAFWSNPTNLFSTHMWTAAEPPNTPKQLTYNLGALPGVGPGQLGSNVLINQIPSSNMLAAIQASGRFSFSVQDDTMVRRATLTYNCEGGRVADTTGGVFINPATIVPSTTGTGTSPSTLTKTATTTSVGGPGTINWVLNVNNQTPGATVNVIDNIPSNTTLVPGSIVTPTWWANNSTANQVNVTGNNLPTSASFAIPFTPTNAATITSASTGGDGYRPFFYGNDVYSLYHHTNRDVSFNQIPYMLYCANANTGVVCPGSPFAIPTVAGNPLVHKSSAAYTSTFHTPLQFSEYVSPDGKLFFFAHSNVTGPNYKKPVVVCVDLVSKTSCGIHTYSSETATSDQANFFEHVEGGVFGGKLYAHLVNGRVLCYNAVPSNAPTPCATISAPTGFGYTAGSGSWPQRLEVGDRYFRWIKKISDGTQWIDCINMATGNRCAATFPFNPGVSNHSPMLPISTTGAATPNGFCLPWNTPQKCFDSNGGPLTSPAPLAALGTLVSPFKPNSLVSNSIGTAAFYKGKAFYIADSSISTKRCFSYTAPHDCAWPPTATTLIPTTPSIAPGRPTDHFYEAVADPYRDNCIWALGDAGVLRAFDAVTGGTCGQSTTISKAIGLVKPNLSYCDGKPHTFSWGQVSIVGLAVGTHYTLAGSTLTIKNASTSAVIVSGPLTGTTSSISGIASNVNQLQVEVNLNLTPAGLALVNSGSSAAMVNVTWTADPPQICFQTTVACGAGAVTNQASATILQVLNGVSTPITSNAATVNVISSPGCTGTPTATDCCPTYLSNNSLITMFDNAAHNTPTPYQMTMNLASPAHVAFRTAVNAQLALMQAGACGNATGIKVTYTMYNTNSTTAPTAASVPNPLGLPWTVLPTPFSITYNLTSSPVIAGTAGFTVNVNPNYFVVIATAQAIGPNGEPMKCGDLNGDCFKKLRFGDIHNPVSIGLRTTGPQAPARAGRIAF